MTPSRLLFLALVSCAALPPVLRADPKLASLFQDHAVLQRDKPIQIWGTSDAGEHLAVAFGGQTVTVTAGADGKWMATLDPQGANSAGGDLLVAGKSVVTAHDVVVGDVWLCAGASNMEFTLEAHDGVYGAENAATETAAARYPSIRQFKVARKASAAAADSVSGDWKACSPETAGEFSAVGYFFARDLADRLDVPIGILNVSWARSSIAAWLSPGALPDFPGSANGAAEAGVGDPSLASSLYNGMVTPLLPFAIKGIVWYQGEGDVSRAADYAKEFPALITSWRTHFNQGDFPFLWVQLANYSPHEAQPGEPWAALREAQAKALSLPATGQAVAIDIGEKANVYPHNKQEVGRRLALIAKAQIYSFAVDYSGPTYDKATADGSAMRVHFLFAGEGLTASGKPLQSFELAGADKVFHPASANISGDSVIVRSAAVPKPVAVRYAWRNAPDANLFNGAGLPAAPFRSDSW
ncbi:MAG TPA: sialate O-acetylesterase [Opitutaceae bacterium]|jgi:sialate O-acetylesterase|nr:sialate O-acetylesterase [Opitutaceae bacterium]